MRRIEIENISGRWIRISEGSVIWPPSVASLPHTFGMLGHLKRLKHLISVLYVFSDLRCTEFVHTFLDSLICLLCQVYLARYRSATGIPSTPSLLASPAKVFKLRAIKELSLLCAVFLMEDMTRQRRGALGRQSIFHHLCFR